MTATSTVTVQGFSHVAIGVDDVEEAERFYCGVLGFSKLPRPDFGIPGIWLRVGDLQLHLIGLDQIDGRNPAHFALHVPTETFADTVAALEAAGVTFVSPPSSRVDFGTTVWAAQLSDPFGNMIEITDMGPLPADA